MKNVILFQRVESGLIFLASIYFFHHQHFNLLLFIVFLFAIDVSMIGYATKNNTIGAQIYNVGHSYILPVVLLVLGVVTANNVLLGSGLIWAGHVGLDRALGYGLKLDSGFTDTHLGKIGKK